MRDIGDIDDCRRIECDGARSGGMALPKNEMGMVFDAMVGSSLIQTSELAVNHGCRSNRRTRRRVEDGEKKREEG